MGNNLINAIYNSRKQNPTQPNIYIKELQIHSIRSSNCLPTQKKAGFIHSKINYNSYNMDLMK